MIELERQINTELAKHNKKIPQALGNKITYF